MSVVVIAIGISGSGKTTFLEKVVGAHPNVVYVNLDNIRSSYDSLGMKFTDHYAKNKFAWQCARNLMIHAFATGKDLVIDCTNTFLHDRIDLINFCHANGASKVIGIFFNTDFDTCLARQSNPGRHVCLRRDVLKHQLDQLNEFPPSFHNGFHRLIYIENNQHAYNL